MKTIISKNKLNKIETLLYAGFGAFGIIITMDNGMITDRAIRIRNNSIQEIIKLLTN